MATYNINKFAYNGNTYNLVPDINNIQVASVSNKGIVDTDLQSFLGIKKFYNAGQFASICLGTTNATNFQNEKYGPLSIIADFGHGTEVRGARFWFCQYSPTAASGSTTFTGHREVYKLPWCTNGMTSDVVYDIITSKNNHTVLLSDDTFNSSSSAVTLTGAMNYALLNFLGRPGDDLNASLVVPTANITTSDVIYQMAGQSNYFSIKLRSSGSNVIMTYNATSNTSKGRISRVYGIQ